MLLTEVIPEFGNRSSPVSPANFLDWRAESRSFDHLSAVEFDSFSLTGKGEPIALDGARVSEDYFQVANLEMVAGRGFLPEEMQQGATPVVVLNEGAWRRWLGGNPDLVGEKVEIDGRAHQVVGIAKANFLSLHDLWVPLPLDPHSASRGRRSLGVFAELAPGVTLAQAREEMGLIASRLAAAYPKENPHAKIAVDPLLDRIFASLKPALFGLEGVGFLMLLLAAANVTSLLLARAVARERETAICAALGARPRDLARALLGETALFVALATLAGLGIAFLLTRALSAARLEAIPRIGELGLGRPVLFCAAAIALLVTLGCSLLPLRLALSRSLTGSMASRPIEGRSGLALRRLLVSLQVALALVLVTAAGLTLVHFGRLSRAELGFEPKGVLGFEIALPAGSYASASDQVELYQRLLAKLEALPGASRVALTSPKMLSGQSPRRSFYAEAASTTERQAALTRTISPDYLELMHVPLLEGRRLSGADDATAQRVVLVNQTFARGVWPGGSAVGKRLSFDQPDFEHGGAWTIVGVVADARQARIDSEIAPEVFFPMAQQPARDTAVLIRTQGDPLAIASALPALLRSLDPALPMRHLAPLDEAVSAALARPRYGSLVLALFAGLALALAGLGIYGVLRHVFERRSRELGIRMALGAGRREVAALVVRHGVATVGAGAALGLLGAIATGRVLVKVLYGLRSFEPAALAGALALLLATTIAAIASPARRATHEDPAQALRREG